MTARWNRVGAVSHCSTTNCLAEGAGDLCPTRPPTVLATWCGQSAPRPTHEAASHTARYDRPHVGQEPTMLRTFTTSTRALALAAVALTAVTACQNDGPIEPTKAPGFLKPSLINNKPTLSFNGILFSGTHESTKNEIYSMNPDGSGIFRLTNDTVTDAHPDVSPTAPAFVWARVSPDGQSS